MTINKTKLLGKLTEARKTALTDTNSVSLYQLCEAVIESFTNPLLYSVIRSEFADMSVTKKIPVNLVREKLSLYFEVDEIDALLLEVSKHGSDLLDAKTLTNESQVSDILSKKGLQFSVEANDEQTEYTYSFDLTENEVANVSACYTAVSSVLGDQLSDISITTDSASFSHIMPEVYNTGPEESTDDFDWEQNIEELVSAEGNA